MILFLLACASQSINSEDSGPVGNDGSDTDAAGDTDSNGDTDADADTDADSDTDTDTDADTDSDTDADADPVDAAATIGRVYSFSLEDATIVKPSGMGTLLDGQLTQSILLEVQYADATSMDLMVGPSLPNEWESQDYCTATSALAGASFAENPSFSVGPTTLEIAASGVTLSLGDLYLSGTFAADLSEITNGELSSLLDTRPLDALAQEYGVGSACELLSYVGASCVACADGSETCVEFEATKMTGTSASIDLMEIQGTNCEGCESGVPAADAVCY